MGKDEPTDLHKQAEELLKKRFEELVDDLYGGDPQRLSHELHVHQVELEMQNEELRKSHAELEESRARYSELYDFAPVGYFTFDKSGLIIEVNLTGAGQLGVERNLLIKKAMSPFILKDDQDVFFLHRGKVFETKELQTCELRLKRKNGGEFYAQLQSHAVEDKAGNAAHCMTAVSNITERKRAEQALLEINETLERRVAERTEALRRINMELEQFAYIAAHDLRAPHRIVTSYLQMIEKRYRDQLDKNAGEFFDFITESLSDFQSLLDGLLEYSRVGSRGKPFELTDLNSVVKRAAAALKAEINESSAEITHGDLPEVYADETQMTQLFQHLIGNAIKFRSGDAPRINIISVLKGNQWTIRVSDNGMGIDPKFFDKIFLIFQRLHTKAEYPGSGVGLAVCQKIVERHGGRIWVESEAGRGAVFCFTMPQTTPNPSLTKEGS